MNPRPTSLFAFLLVTAPAIAAEPVAIGDRFRIDRTEVTIDQFRAFAQSKGIKTAAELEGGGFEYGAGWGRRPDWSVYRPFGEEPSGAAEPAVHVSWTEARDFCAARGGRLPTADEWRMAAYTETRGQPTGGLETGRTYSYPTGEAPQGLNSTGDDPWPRHAPAGETAAGVNGLTEMGGNVWEWLADRQGNDALTAGGSWWYGPDKARSSAMQWKPASFYAVYLGFRCAYDLI
jgi:formylglycine-generating enzyme required for sulfatase activity